MVTMFFTVSVINNYALNFNIAMPLHMIFRSVWTPTFSLSNVSCSLTTSIQPLLSPCFNLLLVSLQGSLIANMIMGIIILKKRYLCLLRGLKTSTTNIWPLSFCSLQYHSLSSCAYLSQLLVFHLLSLSLYRYSASKYLSIALVSAGIFICTIMSAKQVVSLLQNKPHCWYIHIVVAIILHFQTVSLPVISFLCFFWYIVLHLQNVASEGSEEQGFYALMHWLIGESSEPMKSTFSFNEFMTKSATIYYFQYLIKHLYVCLLRWLIQITKFYFFKGHKRGQKINKCTQLRSWNQKATCLMNHESQ